MYLSIFKLKILQGRVEFLLLFTVRFFKKFVIECCYFTWKLFFYFKLLLKTQRSNGIISPLMEMLEKMLKVAPSIIFDILISGQTCFYLKHKCSLLMYQFCLICSLGQNWLYENAMQHIGLDFIFLFIRYILLIVFFISFRLLLLAL